MRSETIALPRRLRLGTDWLFYLPVILLLWIGSGRGVPAGLVPLTARVQGLITIFLGIFIEAFPFVVAGVLVSSAIGLFASDQFIQRLVPNSPIGAALAGGLLGLGFPICECGTVPATRRLLQKGVPLPFGVAFLLAAPVINPIVIVSTYVAFNGDWLIVGGRVGLTLAIAVLVALVLSRLPNSAALLAKSRPEPSSGCDHHDHSADRSLAGLLAHSAEELIEMSRWLVIGALLAATLQTFVSQSVLLSLGDGPVLSVLVLMGLAVLLSICSTVDAFIALALSIMFGPGALLAFLVFGPMIDIKSGLMFLTTLTPRAILLILGLVTPLVVVAGVLINFLV